MDLPAIVTLIVSQCQQQIINKNLFTVSTTTAVKPTHHQQQQSHQVNNQSESTIITSNLKPLPTC